MSKIIVALDGMSWAQAVELARVLSGKVWGFKLNDILFDREHLSLKQYGRIMLDPKLYDIPQTMSNSFARLLADEPDLITVHASVGLASLRTLVQRTNVNILAVTALTSFSEAELFAVYGSPRKDVVRRLATIAADAGVYGIVCGYPDLAVVNEVSTRLIKVCPGFRRPEDEAHDQAQTGTGDGADLVVVGRPITQAEDPVTVTDSINLLLT